MIIIKIITIKKPKENVILQNKNYFFLWSTCNNVKIELRKIKKEKN